ncbi:hypothetical protein IHQ71_23925 [Rhizobium sp. TH2]|uniref:hypothetical protein n=1 Tax=Rhizobium sp. TH2 TaxID=2775403 RepID=UPI002157C46A|nr:hypothetical protein [Rhizobium sp. TH2]UVC08172.1 hypothetical protein IHQ71_23925 [Rhizobium sp. TH2]
MRDSIDYFDSAFPIPLTDDDLKAIGEICAIQGQIEYLMQVSLSRATALGMETSQLILGSTNLTANAEIWLNLLYHYRHVLPSLSLPWAEHFFEELCDFIRGRNDLLHAVYGYNTTLNLNDGTQRQIFTLNHFEHDDIDQTAVAMRVKNSVASPTAKISEMRNKAARLSLIIATHLLGSDCKMTQTSQDRLGSPPPPRSKSARLRLDKAHAQPPSPPE